MSLPESIFKYQNANMQNLVNLKKETIYMSSAQNFNDPYDCAMSPKINRLKINELKIIRNAVLARGDIDPKIQDSFRTNKDEKLLEKLQNTINKLVNIERDKFLRERGVCCFSETNSNLLMWAHYANSFAGFCLEFKIVDYPFTDLKKVKYSKTIPNFNITKFFTEPDGDQIIDLYLTKAKNWEYEKEWRILYNQSETEHPYPENSLKAIYFGPKMKYVTKEIICLIVQGQNENVKFFEGKLSEFEFKISFDEFYYIPYIEAKKRGLLETEIEQLTQTGLS